MKIEVELPDFKGYEYTGEYRYPLHDEWGCRGPNGEQVRNCNPLGALFILREINIPEPKPTLLERIEEKWPDKEVVMLEQANNWLVLSSNNQPHHVAQSMTGYFRYVYEHNIANEDRTASYFVTETDIVSGETILPVACLFNK